MMRNSLICKLINVQASMKEKEKKKIKNEQEDIGIINTENKRN